MNEQPNNETLIQSSSRDLQIIEDDAFSYEGYQVVRGEFFAAPMNHPLHLMPTKYP